MVSHRSSNSFPKSSLVSIRRPSRLSLTVYVICLFAFSILFFIFHSNVILEEEQKKPPSLSKEKSESKQLQNDILWEAPFSYGLHPCVKPTTKYKAAQGLDRYMTVRSKGGLNQMRAGIADMVAVAHIMTATLVIPQLDKRSFWQDTSTFSDIFDERHFITTLKEDVRIVKELPKELESAPRARKHFTSWSGMSYYGEMTELWKDHQAWLILGRIRYRRASVQGLWRRWDIKVAVLGRTSKEGLLRLNPRYERGIWVWVLRIKNPNHLGVFQLRQSLNVPLG